METRLLPTLLGSFDLTNLCCFILFNVLVLRSALKTRNMPFYAHKRAKVLKSGEENEKKVNYLELNIFILAKLF